MDEHTVLFWVFVIFFIIIGVLSLLALTGVLRTDPSFRKWAVSGFVIGVGTAIFGLFRAIFSTEVPLYITLEPPGGQTNSLDLMRGSYSYDEPTSAGTTRSSSGTVEMTLGPGGWQVRLPQKALNKAVELTFQETNGDSWRVRRFYPNHNKQTLIKGLSSSQSRQSSAEPSVERTPVRNAFAVIVGLAFAQQQSSLRFDNYAQQTDALSGRPSYKWRVFLNESPAVLDTIAEVEYVLHPTFPEPIQVRKDPNTKFALEASGWGQFTILITIRYKDGRIQKTSYPLDFSKGWPREEIVKPSSVTPFAGFTPKVEIEKDEFEVQGSFSLAADSDGIDPLKEAVELELMGGTRTFSRTIPADCFKQDGEGKFKCERKIDGVDLDAKITRLKGNVFDFKIKGEQVNLTNLVNPVTVKLTISNDSGNTQVTAKFK
jgi:hypothetical protein